MFGVRRVLVASALTVALVSALVSIAFAHAEFVSSVPAAGSTVASEPAVVKGTFSEAINPKGSSFTVTAPNGARADVGDGHVDLTDPNRVTMLVTLKPGLGSGKYTVNWATVSALDGDAANATYVFTVSAPAPVVAPVAQPAVSAAVPAALPKSGGTPLLPVAGVGIAFAGFGIALRRRGH